MEALSHESASNASQPVQNNDENNNHYTNQHCTNDQKQTDEKCSSCGTEQATVVCSGCSSQANTNNLDCLPALKTSADLHLNEHYNSTDHMLYCTDCFRITHANLDTSKHVAVHIAVQQPEDIQLIVEDKMDDLLDQIELSSHTNSSTVHLDRLKRRIGHLNDVKQSIREMNEIIRDDLYVDFGALADLMQKKLNEISDRIKEKLKDAYSVVRDLHGRLNEQINDVEQTMRQLEAARSQSVPDRQKIKLLENHIMSQMDQVNEQLRGMCESNGHSCTAISCSLFVDNNLYPQFNYSVDLNKLIDAVDQLDVKISAESNTHTNFDELCAVNGFEFDALVHTGIHSDGSFWAQFVGVSSHTDNVIDSFRKNRIKSDRLLEEMSRCVRSASIGDPNWLTYDQLDDQTPQEGQLCFCLDEKTRKWHRARVISVCASTQKCHVIYVDTGVSHVNNLHPFENVLPWRHFQLTELPHRAIKCVLHNSANLPLKYEHHIDQETKFEFKDMTTNKAMRCVLVEMNQDQTWTCQLYKINEDNNRREKFVSVNKKIIELNKKKSGLDTTVKFASRDIRLLNALSSSSSSSFTPKVNVHVDKNDECSLTTSEEPFDTNLELSSALNVSDGHEENADVDDQVAERRFYKNNSGTCHVTTSVSNEGIFWIKPMLRHNLHDEFEKMSSLIDDFIRRTNYRSYAELKIEPDKHKKCFVRAFLRKSVQFYRGYIEKVFSNREACRVRLMDSGHAREAAYADIYPHRRLDFNSLASKGRDTDGFNDTDNHGLKLNYLAIRCSLFQTNFNNLNAKRNYFNLLVANKRLRFNLIEQVTINQLKCWYTEIYAHNGQLINMSVFNALANDTIRSCATSSSTATSYTNREWQPIETRAVMSMYDLKETSLDTLDESASIKVKSDAQGEQFRVKTKYVSCPLFADEPEWLVNTDEIVNQPSFVTNDLDPDHNNDKKKPQRQQRNKKRRHQCKPFHSDNNSNWRNGRGGDGNGTGGRDGNGTGGRDGNGTGGRDGNGTGGRDGNGTGGHGTGNNSKLSNTNNSQSQWRRSHASQEHKNNDHVTHESDNSSSAFNDVFLNNNNENSSLDQEEFEAVQQQQPMNSSPNSPYQKLFKLNGNVNSYEQVLSRISENERVDDEAEKMRSLHLTQNGQFVSSKIEANDTSLDSMPRLIIDQTDDDEAFNEPVHPTLDQTHQIPNRHIINDTETNRSIKSERPCQQTSAKNRSYSAADVALVERHRLNIRPVLSTSSSSSSDTSSLLSDLKKIKKNSDLDSDESFESCDEEVKNNIESNKNKCHEAKLERMKKFTVSIFVDDFEADSSKISNESSTSLSTNNEVEQSRLNPNFFAVKSTECRTDNAKSLEEFENNEAVHSYKRVSALDQDVFMFTANPVHLAENRCCSLASRPPAPASHPPINACLSTIVELSNECSNNSECEAKKAVSLLDETTGRNWLSDIEHNSSEFQKKVDFFNKNADSQQDGDWYRNVTVRRTRRNSRDYDTLLNESRRTKSASSLSDNGHVVNSLSNNCLISESFYLSGGARLNVTLDASFSSRLRHNSTANSVLVTDQLFERFCLLENDRIMNESSMSIGMNGNFGGFRIRSQLLSELLDEPVSMPRRTFSSPDISSYNSDSLFNSHMIITPICSELVSPNQPGSIVSRSISNQQSTPHKHVNSFKSPTNSCQSSLPPTPPQNQPRDEDNYVTFSPIQKVKDDGCNYLKSFPAQNFVKERDRDGDDDERNFPQNNNLSRDPNSILQSSKVKDDGCNFPQNNNLSRDPNSILQSSNVKVTESNLSKNVMLHNSNSTSQSSNVNDERFNCSKATISRDLDLTLQSSEVKVADTNYSNSYPRDPNSVLEPSEVKVTENSFLKNFMPHDPISSSQSLKAKDDDNCNSPNNALSRDPNSTLQSSQVNDERFNYSKATLSRDLDSTLQSSNVKVNGSDFSKDAVSNDTNPLLQTTQQVKDVASNFSKNTMSRDTNSKLTETSVKIDLTNAAAALPPAPHYLLLKPNRNESPTTTTTTTTRLDRRADPITMSNSCPNLNEPNKHIANYLNTIKKSTGVQLEPVIVKRRSNSATRLNNFKSANFSLYGLDNEDEQEAKRKSLSECDSMDAKSSFSSSAQKILSLDVSNEQQVQSDSFKFPPPPEQFMNSSNDTLPPPPDQNELDALINNNNAPPTSSSSQTTVVAAQTDSPRLKTFMNSLKHMQSTNGDESTKSDNSFKIDHLLDINPKRLYKNSKFKCRINDVIDESGRFWLEVIYGEDDERKFHQMFKYFNLHVRLAEAPESVRPNDHVAALYKNSWHRARVLHHCAPSKVKVRFLDLGLDKILDKHADLRHTDQKFFNFPVKGLLCSLYIDEHVHQLPIEPQRQLTLNKRLRLCREARKHFVKMVYKKILFVKVIELGQEYEAECDAHTSICKIKLGCQARRGIIDVYMYLLSKYDREKYEFLKTLKKYIQSRPLLMSLQQQSLVQTTTITTTETNTVSTCTTSSAMASPPDSLNGTLKKMQEEECDEEEGGEEEQEDMLDQEEDYYESDEDDVLFTDTVNYYYSKNTNKDASLDLTPVKEHHSRYTQLNISPVDLSTPGHDHAPLPPLDQSTTKVANKLRASAAHHAATPVVLPPATALSHKYVKMVRSEQQSLDADTSLTARCCNLAGLKKWAKASGKSGANLPKSFKMYAQEGPRDQVFQDDYTLNKSLTAKKVKFQIK